MTRMIVAVTGVALALSAIPADAGPVADRIEDRLDRRESIRDEAVDHGPRDVIEDRIDRIESRLDRRGIEYTPRIDRHERRKIRWWWQTRDDT